MLIRAEQMTVFAETAEKNFVRRIAAHLRENYAAAIVRLPDGEAAVGELPDEKLHSLVEISIERARRHDLTYESSISAFSALMFEVSPNFDRHRLSQVMLTDETVEPDGRLDGLLETLNEKNWETIRAEYDPEAWEAASENDEPAKETDEKTDDAEQKPAEVVNVESAETAMNAAPPQPAKPAVAIDDINFNGTMVNAGGAKKPSNAETDEDFDQFKTIVNYVVPKEK